MVLVLVLMWLIHNSRRLMLHGLHGRLHCWLGVDLRLVPAEDL